MTLVNRRYFDEIIGTLREAGEKVRHVFPDVPDGILESRIRSQVIPPGDPERDESARQSRLKNVALCRGSQGAARGHGHAAIGPGGPVTARGRGARSRRRIAQPPHAAASVTGTRPQQPSAQQAGLPHAQ